MTDSNPAHAEALVNHDGDIPWEYIPGEEDRDDVIRWKTFCGSDKGNTHSLAFGICELPPGTVLHAHHHAENEAYYIQDGVGKVYLDGEVVEVSPGSVVYVPENLTHGIRNGGEGTLTLLWFFAVNRWSDVIYHMEFEKEF